MVGLQAKVLGRLGRMESSPSKSVCSILPIAICGPGLSGAPASIMLPLAALVSPHRTWHDQLDVVSYAAKFIMGCPKPVDVVAWE